MNDCDPFKHKMMGLLDNELTSEEAVQVNEHLIRCESCREEFDRLCQSSAGLESISFKEPADRELDQIWKSPFSRFTRNSGILLVFGGWLFLVGFAVVEFMQSDSEPPLPKIAFAGIIIGFFILLGGVIRDRLHTYKSDPYKEIKR